MRGKTNILVLIFSIAIPLVVGFVSAFTTQDKMYMFNVLNKPKLSPPSWLFPIAWSILYILMGIACYLLIMSDHPLKSLALFLYTIQLIFNFFWSVIFFNQEMYWLALFWLLAMWAMIIALLMVSARINLVAMFLLLPLLLWTTFAAYLNYSIARLN